MTAGSRLNQKQGEFAEDHADRRSRMYLEFFREVLREYPSIPDTVFIMDVGDMPPTDAEHANVSISETGRRVFHLAPGYRLHRLESLSADRHCRCDPCSEKATSAIFVGGTSGQMNTVDTVRNPIATRLRSAKHFRGHPNIHFLLPSLSQCVDAEAEQALRDLGFGGSQIPWSEQFLHKFIISVDGNGAACSRIVIALKSNSVLLN